MSYLVRAVMYYVFMWRGLSYRPRLLRCFAGPVLSSAVMGVTAWAVFGLLARILGHGRFATLLAMAAAILAAVAVYLAAAIFSRSVTKEDMRLIPGGEKIAKILRMR